MEVKWANTDVVRIGFAGDYPFPAILRIDVMPRYLSGDDGVVVTSKRKELLEEYNIANVYIEMRESIATRSAGLKLLNFSYPSDPSADVREPLATTLDHHIFIQSTSWTVGTGGFFIAEGGNIKRLLLVTARHVVLTPDNKNKIQSRHNVTLFSDVAFNKYLEFIQYKIEGKALIARLRRLPHRRCACWRHARQLPTQTCEQQLTLRAQHNPVLTA